MAKRKKASASPSYKKKSIATPDKKTVKKSESKMISKKTKTKLDTQKIETISDTIQKMNKKFECLIEDCKSALTQLNDNKISTIA